MRKALLLACLLILLFGKTNAEMLDDVSISAKTISYSADGTSLEASGSVEVSSADIRITADHLVCYLSNKRVVADQGFTMELKNGLMLSGGLLDYVIKDKQGDTENVRIYFRNSVLTGGMAKINEEKIELTDTSFNTCGLLPPHYHVSSYTTTLYPDDGWVIGYLGYLWVDGVPAVPVPVYIYDLSAAGLGEKMRTSDVLAVPEAGSNDQDGQFISEKVPWIANRNLTGRLTLFVTEKGGLGGGIESDYSINDYNDLNTRIYYDKRYNYFGGLTHTMHFGPNLGKRQEDIYTFFKIRQQLLMDLITNVSINERLNYQRVSFLPDVTLRVNEFPALADNFRVAAEIGYGHITEEGHINEITDEAILTEDDRTRLVINTKYSFPTNVGKFDIGLNFYQNWYGKKEPWIRFAQNLRLSNAFGDLDTYIGHMHYYLFDGMSPFLFEQYRTIPSDEFSLGLGYNFAQNRFSIDYAYYVPDWEPMDLDYGLSLGFHCYTLDLKYRASRKEFLIGVSLISR